MAKLYFRYGAMNSGKSTALLQVAHNYEELGMHVLLIKPAIDTKGDTQIMSRLGVSRQADILANNKLDLFQKTTAKKEDDPLISCVLADEAQFFTPQQVEQLFKVAVELQLPVICYGLRVDFQTKAFPGSARLFELAHSIEELKTICRCGKKAIFTGRKVDGAFVATGSQVAIDGESNVSYEALCGNCYLKFVGDISS